MTLKEKCTFLEERIKRLNEIGLSLSRENDINVIFELIMEEAKNITNSDGRTLYMISDDGQTMKFEILRNDFSLIPNAFEECVRFDHPTNILGRKLNKDIELHGKEMKKSKMVV